MQIPRLKTWREAKGETQVTLSEISGVAEATISRLEHGMPTTPATARKLADALDITVADLLESPPVAKAEMLGKVEKPVPLAEARAGSSEELRAEARRLKAEWNRLATYDRVTQLSKEEYLETLRRLEEIEEALGALKERLDELDPPLCWITYRLDTPPEVEFYRSPTDEEKADLDRRLGNYKVVESAFELVAG